ncbi:MAG: hypothetical protein IT529_20605 [Burkholderiales bacterium]|nr:hypothetical protein [Burkholderiales bacterium]
MKRVLVRHRRARRVIGVVLVVLGGGFMWLAPETPVGAALLATGILLEIAGITLEHRQGRAGKD